MGVPGYSPALGSHLEEKKWKDILDPLSPDSGCAARKEQVVSNYF